MASRFWKAWPCVLALLVCLPEARGACPSGCLCSGNDRHVDCSGRNLTALPHGLQDNITHLNLSHNRFVDLDHQLTRFANLRTLDVSHNGLLNLPAHLPRSLWEIYATHNAIRVLQKLDTAYQWNLRVLDVSGNLVERAVLINNTLSSLRYLNLSSNKLWTVPTNMPHHTETVDLSDNFLTQILPGTLVRLSQLAQLYLHNNKFTYIPDRAFDQLARLELLTLYNNPWSCGEALSYLQRWMRETSATVVGPPCSEEAATSWKGARPFSAATSAAENRLLVKAMKAAEPTGPPMTTGPSKTVHPPFRMEEATLGATVGQTVTFSSTDRPLALYPEDPSTEKLNSYEAAAATRTVYIQDTTIVNSSTSTTPMTLSITSGVPINHTKRPQSTTVTVKREEATTKAQHQVPSKANFGKVSSVFILLLNAVVLASG
ncbi:oligodendrocyte-myelin glycoprotein [Hemicordylus capensis]|uniref:oligodendrocyte-myelin glycoprotein n=1 Tax=Hemicordylus capensis TaxID=884348 RepID=UPI002302837B|nr:oligodendrocyte-myelin glycoprotein [Hemicordylus capensis]